MTRQFDVVVERVREAIELYLEVEGEPSLASNCLPCFSSWGLKPSG
jgi:hypothetical protein